MDVETGIVVALRVLHFGLGQVPVGAEAGIAVSLKVDCFGLARVPVKVGTVFLKDNHFERMVQNTRMKD